MTLKLKTVGTLIATLAIFCTSITPQDLPGISNTRQCNCPAYGVIANLETVKAGEVVEFRVFAGDQSIREKRFEWTVSAGTIVSGQGTSKIEVQTTEELLTATRPLPGALPSPGEHGFVFSMSSLGRRSISIEATAKLTESPECCQPKSASVEVGTRSGLVNQFANVIDLKLSQGKLVAPCEPGRTPAHGQGISDNMIVDVRAVAVDAEEDVLAYNFQVSGGRVIGQGAHVSWDLTGVKPGMYSITAGVDDGCGICGATKTETVTVARCLPSCSLIECPDITINGPDILAVENAFTANVSGGSVEVITFNWSVAGGVILNGQGTPAITVKMPTNVSEKNFSVTVNVGGLEEGHCISSVTRDYFDGKPKP